MINANNFKCVAELEDVDFAEAILKSFAKDVQERPLYSLTTVFYGAVFSDSEIEKNKFYSFVDIAVAYNEAAEGSDERKGLFGVMEKIIKYSRKDEHYIDYDLRDWLEAMNGLPQDDSTNALKSLLVHTP